MRINQNLLLVLMSVNFLLVVKIVIKLTGRRDEEPPEPATPAPPSEPSPIVYYSRYCDCERQLVVRETFDNDTLHWCSEETTMRGNNQNVLAYSLFGDSEENGTVSRYYSLLGKIPQQSKHFYPGWRIRIYHNILKREVKAYNLLCDTYCAHDHVDLCNVNQMIYSTALIRMRTKKSVPILAESLWKLNMRMWRYLAMLDPQVDRFMARDSDSEINYRESDAVNQWLESPYTFHVVRDHQGHYAQIMGGIFDVKVHQRRDLIQGLTKAMMSHGITSDIKSLDQNLLASIFWPTVKDDAMIHDSHHCIDDWNSLPATPFRTQRINLTFVTDRVGADWGRPIKCPIECRPPEHQDWEYC